MIQRIECYANLALDIDRKHARAGLGEIISPHMRSHRM